MRWSDKRSFWKEVLLELIMTGRMVKAQKSRRGRYTWRGVDMNG